MTDKTFTVQRPDAPPITFTIAGNTASGGAWSEDFTSLVPGDLPVAVLDRMMAMGSQVSDGTFSWSGLGLIGFFELVLDRESGHRFRALCEDADRQVHVGTLGEVADWLIPQLFGRPTVRASESTRGARRTRRTATSSSPAKGSTPARSTRAR